MPELGSISARVLINQSFRACESGNLLLLGVGGTYLNAVSAMGAGTKPWKIVAPRWCLMMRMGMLLMMMMMTTMVFDDSHANDGDNDDHLYFTILIPDNSNISWVNKNHDGNAYFGV